MRRSVTSIPLLVLTAALLAPGASATGAPPTPVDPSPQILAAGEACPFAIEVTAEGKEGFVELPNNPVFQAIGNAPGLRVTLTNLSDPSKTVTVNATGAFRFVVLPDGGLEIRAGGHNVLYGDPEVGATALATTGPIVLEVVEGEIVGMDLSGARVRDLCEELA
jgi:hypothetical protein